MGALFKGSKIHLEISFDSLSVVEFRPCKYLIKTGYLWFVSDGEEPPGNELLAFETDPRAFTFDFMGNAKARKINDHLQKRIQARPKTPPSPNNEPMEGKSPEPAQHQDPIPVGSEIPECDAHDDDLVTAFSEPEESEAPEVAVNWPGFDDTVDSEASPQMLSDSSDEKQAAFLASVYLHLVAALALTFCLAAGYVFAEGGVARAERLWRALFDNWWFVLGGPFAVGFLSVWVSKNSNSRRNQYLAFGVCILFNTMLLIPIGYTIFKGSVEGGVLAALGVVITFGTLAVHAKKSTVRPGFWRSMGALIVGQVSFCIALKLSWGLGSGTVVWLVILFILAMGLYYVMSILMTHFSTDDAICAATCVYALIMLAFFAAVWKIVEEMNSQGTKSTFRH